MLYYEDYSMLYNDILCYSLNGSMLYYSIVCYSINHSIVCYTIVCYTMEKERKMRKEVLNATISGESYRFVENVAEEIGKGKSYALDLIIDAASGNLGTHMILHHYRNGFDRKDGRKKER